MPRVEFEKDYSDKSFKNQSPEFKKQFLEKVKTKLSRTKLSGKGFKPLRGSEKIYRLRIGDWRVIYFFDSDGTRVVAKISRRNERTYKGYG